jgi:lysophospholipase L1-like esterase
MPQATLKPKTNVAPAKQADGVSFGHSLVAALIMLAISVVFLEFVLGLAGIGEQEYLRIDKTTGFAPIAGKHITWWQEGFSRSQINNFGMRDRNYSLAKPKGTMRIAVVGDSLVEALQVAPDETFCRQLENRLNEKAGSSTKFQVMNFGVASYNLGQMYLRIKETVLPFKPDVIVVCVRNDTTMQLAANPNGGFLYARPSFFVGNKNQLIEDDTVEKLWWHSPDGKRMLATSWLREHTHIWGVVSVAAENLIFWYKTTCDNGQKLLAAGAQAGANSKAGKSDKLAVANVLANNQVVQSLNAQGTSDAIAKSTAYLWPIANGLIENMQQLSRQNNAQLILVRLPASKNYENKTETTLLAASAQALKIPMLDLGPSFHKQVDNNRQPLFFDFHLTATGHQFLAEQLFQFLSQNHVINLSEQSAGNSQ